jgi:hypothetical protein
MANGKVRITPPLVALIVLAGLGVFPRPARGSIDEPRSVVISADRLFGLAASRTTTENANAQGTVVSETSVSRTDLALLASSPSTIYSIPRLAVDFTVVGGLTVGGAFGFATGGSANSTTRDTTTTETEGPDSTAFLLAPRAGFAYSLGKLLGLWVRGGFTYARTTTERDTVILGQTVTTKSISSGFALDVEPALTVMPFDHFGFLASAVLDLPLTGTLKSQTITATSTTSLERDQKVRNLGVLCGLFGSF